MNRFMFFLISLGILWIMGVVSCFGSLALFAAFAQFFKGDSSLAVIIPLAIGFVAWIWTSVKLIGLLHRKTSARAKVPTEVPSSN